MAYNLLLDHGGRRCFGSLMDISLDDLVALGSRIRELVFKIKTSNGEVVRDADGSFNLVHILQLDDFKMVIHIPIISKDGGLPHAAKEALESHVHTLNFIKEHTEIPVPEVFHFDTTTNNEINAPYIAMSYISGSPAGSFLWFDDSGPTPLEQRRRNILKQLAQVMSQLSRYRFDKIGALVAKDQGDGREVGPCYLWRRTHRYDKIRFAPSGPFSTTESFMRAFWAETYMGRPCYVGAAKIMEEILQVLPCSPEYVLAHADLDWEDVLADEQGNITGVIGWSTARTMPNFIGCLRYPRWIICDWNPYLYGGRDDWMEDSPNTLQRYRTYYLHEMKKALEAQGSDDYRLTEKSHIFDAFWIAVTGTETDRKLICEKFIDEAKRRLEKEGIPDGLNQDAKKILDAIALGKLNDEDWTGLRKGMRALTSSEE